MNDPSFPKNSPKLIHIIIWQAINSRPEVFCKKGVLRNFAKFTGKHLCQSFFLNKVAGLRPLVSLESKYSLILVNANNFPFAFINVQIF